MKRLRDPRWALILVFATLLGLVSAIQTGIEIGQDSGVRALNLFAHAPTAANLRAFEDMLEDTSWAARLTRPWLQFVQFAFLDEGGEKVLKGANGWYFYKPGVKYMIARPESSTSSNATYDPAAAIVHFRDQLAARGIRLLVMPVPNKESIYPELLSSRAASDGEGGVLAIRTRELLERLKSSNVEVIDLFEIFQKARRNGPSTNTPLYLAQDTHWSPAGVALAAQAAARRLSSLGWMQQGSSIYMERPVQVRRLGDILRMLQSPALEQSVAPESVTVMQVAREGTNDLYADQAEAELLVIGDSFMRIFQQDEPGSAGFVAHLAKELKQPLLSLVNDGGGATLVREELSFQPVFLKNKKVVLWEFVERDIGLAVKGWPLVRLPSVRQEAATIPNQHVKPKDLASLDQ